MSSPHRPPQGRFSTQKRFPVKLFLGLGMHSTHDLTGLRRYCLLIALVAALFIAPSCAKRTQTRVPPPPHPGETQTGIASWYGEPYHGRRSANGEIYDMENFTAAHRTWPFDTMVRVTNLTNRREVDVRITDRGPFVDGRIIDLSRAAAQQIDMIGPGTARVRIRVLAPQQAGTGFVVQAGAFVERANAEALRKRLSSFPHARVVSSGSTRALYRVLVGEAMSREQAEEMARQVRARGIEALAVRE